MLGGGHEHGGNEATVLVVEKVGERWGAQPMAPLSVCAPLPFFQFAPPRPCPLCLRTRLFLVVQQDPTHAVAETVRSGSSLVDVVWRPSGLSPTAWPDLMAGPLTSKPLVLLVNSNTASASEVLAGEDKEGRGADNGCNNE